MKNDWRTLLDDAIDDLSPVIHSSSQPKRAISTHVACVTQSHQLHVTGQKHGFIHHQRDHHNSKTDSVATSIGFITSNTPHARCTTLYLRVVPNAA
jgi:hypothetical protein